MSQFTTEIKSLLASLPTYKVRKESENYLNININGNKKLINHDGIAFMIWNLPAVITCPYATEHCKALCYALKAERVYPSVKPSRTSNFEASKNSDFALKMIFTIETELATKKFYGKKVIFRIHESGDFYNREYTKAWVEIARHFEGRVVFMAYTKSLVFFKGLELPENLVVRASVWDDTKAENIELIKELGLPIYTAVANDYEIEKNGFSKCDCKDCANCGKCWNKAENRIACVIH